MVLLTTLERPIPDGVPAWHVRETSPPYGAPPETSPAELAGDLVDAWHALARAEAAVALAEGDTLRLVADQRLHLRLGFSSFHDFCVEAAEMTASTGKRRVAVSRLAAGVPALRDALLDGTVSQCQALVLRPVVTSESAAWWIAVAARSTVTELRAAVRQAAAAEDDDSPESPIDESSTSMDESSPHESSSHESTTGEPSSEQSTHGEPSSSASRGSAKSANGPFEEEPEGRRVSIAAPIAARLAFEQGLEQARKTLGYDAPVHACIAAMLAEVAGDGLTSDPAEIDGEPVDRLQRRLQRLCRSQHQARPFPTSHDSASSGRAGDRSTRSGDGSARAEDGSTRAEDGSTRAEDGSAERCAASFDAAHSAPKAVPEYLRDSMNRARRTIGQVYEQLDSFRELLESAPTEADVADPASLVERLEEIRAVSAPIHVLRCGCSCIWRTCPQCGISECERRKLWRRVICACLLGHSGS